MLKLTDREWKEFKIIDIFKDNFHGKRLTKAKRQKGNIPLLTASEQNQGVSEFVSNQDMKLLHDVITIDMFGHSFYHNYTCCGDDNIYFLINNNISKFAKFFIIICITNNTKKYNYGNQFRQGNLDNDKIMLPINSQSEPDYEFMEEYTKQLIKRKINSYKKYILKRENSLVKSESLNQKDWKEFYIQNIFNIKIGKNIDGCKIDKCSGKTPYITRKEVNNGLDGFIDNNKALLNISHPVITIGNETAKPFVQQYPFYTGTKVNIMSPKIKLSVQILLFISQSLALHKNKYSYSYTINSTRLKKQKILLPVNSQNEPDYEYMENYMKNIEFQKIKNYLSFLEKQYNFD